MPPPPIFVTELNDDAHEFALLARRVEDAITFLPPAMRDPFMTRMLALIAFAESVVATAKHRERSDPDLTLVDLRKNIDAWRSEMERIRSMFR